MAENFIVVGDIHGCRDQLNEIIEKCRPFPDHRFVFLGDYIDRGPCSNEVIDIVRAMDAVCLKGNHEQSYTDYCRKVQEGKAPADNPSAPRLSAENKKWIGECLRLYFETEGYVFVHAGLDPERALAEQEEKDLLWKVSDGSYDKLLPKLVFHGHTRVDGVVTRGNRYNLDTGCGFGGPLTAWILPEMKPVQSSASENYSTSKLQSLRKEMESLLGEEAELEDT
jgi:serine/threonine protein phosphatase 1